MTTPAERGGTWVVVLAGGSGVRLWPLSRRSRPKQCLRLLGDRSLLASTLARCAAIAPRERTVVVATAASEEAVRAELGGGEALLIEPAGRNTAASIAWAAGFVARRDPEAVLAVMPADHYIGDDGAFVATALTAADLAASCDRWIVTLGVVPTRPECGYGWMSPGPPIHGRGDARQVADFAEKPDRAQAERWLAEGARLWNSGMFFMAVDRAAQDIARWLPEHAALLAADVADPATYGALPSVSFDCGVLERTDRRAVVPLTIPWSDVGTWGALAGGPGRSAVSARTAGRTLEVDGRDNVLVADGGAVVVVGVEGMAVVHAGDVVLVCPVGRAGDVRRVVELLGERGWDDLL